MKNSIPLPNESFEETPKQSLHKNSTFIRKKPHRRINTNG